MNPERRDRRAAWSMLTLVAVLALVALAPRLGFTKNALAALWTDRSVTAAPTTTAPAPDWVRLARELKPAVVNISTKRIERGGAPLAGPFSDDSPLDQFFQPFFGRVPDRTVRSLGSGFAINPDGYLVTNNHVVDGATEIQVTLSDGRQLPARIVGRDPKTDLALLKIDATRLPVIPLGDSSQLQVGEPVMAIGNPFGLEQTVTTGIVSATGRVIGEGPYDDFIQADASINPGNSGGPLINARGQAVGLNSAIFSESGGSVGIGFAIPINLAKSVVTQLASTGHVVRGWLGVTIQPLTPDLARSFGLADTGGALVASVLDGSPATKARLRAGDVITGYDGRKVTRAEDLPKAVAETPVGHEVALTVIREGTPITLTAKIARLEESGRAQVAGDTPSASLGLAVQSLTPALSSELGLRQAYGVLVRGVQGGSRADNAGLRPGDVIVEIDHQPMTSADELKQLLARHPAGAPLLMLVHRNGGNLYVAIGA